MHKKRLHCVHSSPSSTATVLSEWTKWAGRAAHIKETRIAYKVFYRKAWMTEAAWELYEQKGKKYRNRG